MLKKVKPKFCAYKECSKEFVNYNSSFVKHCSYACQIKDEQSKKIDERIKGFKENLKDHSYWIQKLQVVFNEFIRTRDAGLPCISCGTTKKGIVYHAGHFFSVGAYPNLRFDEYNCHRQCGFNCNTSKHGNTALYAVNLIKKIGQAEFDALYERRNRELKLSIPEIQEKIREYKNKIKLLKSCK